MDTYILPRKKRICRFVTGGSFIIPAEMSGPSGTLDLAAHAAEGRNFWRLPPPPGKKCFLSVLDMIEGKKMKRQQEKYESDVVFALVDARWWSGCFTSSSNIWNLNFYDTLDELEHKIAISSDSDAVSWERTTIAIQQDGMRLGTVTITKSDCTHKHIMEIARCAKPTKAFHVTVTETYHQDKITWIPPDPKPEANFDLPDKLFNTTGIPPDPKPESHFDQPNELSNTILVIGDKRIHVNDYFLAIHSPFFEKLFFGEFAEKGKNEVVLEKIDYDSFIEFLHVIYPERKPVTRENLDGVLGVAHYVHCQAALVECLKFLYTDESFSVSERLCLADKYELTTLLDDLLNNIPASILQSVAKAGAYTFSDRLKMSGPSSTSDLAGQAAELRNFWHPHSPQDNKKRKSRQRTFESDVVFAVVDARWWSGCFTSSSNIWNLNFYDTLDELVYQIAISSRCDAVSWVRATIAIQQDGMHLGTVTITKKDYRQKHIMKIARCAKPTKAFHVTVTETYVQDSTNPPDPKPESHFDQPNQLSNTILVVGDKRIYVNNSFLAIHSPFFEKLFFGEFIEKGKNEVVLEKIDYDSFIEFLRVIYPERKPVTRENLDGVLGVAHYVHCQAALVECSKFLSNDESFPLPEKLCLADKYDLTELLDELLNSVPTVMVQSLARAGAHMFSDRLKIRMFDLLAK